MSLLPRRWDGIQFAKRWLVLVVSVGCGFTWTGGTIRAASPQTSGARQVELDRLGLPQLVAVTSNQTVKAGEDVLFEVQAIGLDPLFYQWSFNGVPIPEPAEATLTVTNAQPSSSGFYRVMVHNRLGSIQSPDLQLIVLRPPVIVQQPQAVNVNPSEDVTFSVVAQGDGSLTYQWRLNGVNLRGQTNSSLILNDVTISNAGVYTVLVRSLGGTTVSQGAMLALRLSLRRGFTMVDQFVQRFETNTIAGQIKGTNTFYSRERGEPFHSGKLGGRSAWFAWRAPSTGIVSFSTAGSTFDTVAAVYTGSSLDNLVQIDRDDDRGNFLTSTLTFRAIRGTQYQIAVDGAGESSGVIILSWSFRPSNEDFAAIKLHPVGKAFPPGSPAAMTAFADFQDRSVFRFQWFLNGKPLAGFTFTNWTVSAMAEHNVGICQLFITNILTGQVIKSDAAPMEIGPGTNASVDKLSDLSLSAVTPAVQTVHRRRSGFTSVSAGSIGTQIMDNFGATTEKGEPNHGGVTGGSSRWFSLVAETNGTMVIDTVGSAIDTVLAVYTGTDFFNLKAVASDDNSAPDGLRSLVSFKAKRGTSYQVAVDGKNGQEGKIHLNWKLGISPTIQEQPVSQTAQAGSDVFFIATASALPAPQIQWLFNGVAIPNATKNILILNEIQGNHSGIYQMKSFNFAGSATSGSAILAVEPGPFRLRPEFSNSRFQLVLEADPAVGYILDASVNLLDWQPILTNAPGSGLVFDDPAASALDKRFYRLRLEP